MEIFHHHAEFHIIRFYKPSTQLTALISALLLTTVSHIYIYSLAQTIFITTTEIVVLFLSNHKTDCYIVQDNFC